MSSPEFANEILQTHNKYRAKHGAPDLKIKAELNNFAQEWAENLASEDKMEHRSDNPYGENLYMAGSTDPNWNLKGETVVKSWYDEIKLYKFGEPSPKNSSEVGHFTQLVWKGTAELGIGEAKSEAGKVYVVCNYDPPGNVVGEFVKNVLPLDNTAKNKNGNGQSMEDTEETERQRIVLTASQEKMGIRFVQPKIQIVESMKRLHAVPSEKIRVWSVWLTKVEEEANEWHSWLRSHINLLLRMSEYLQKAQEELEKDEKLRDTEIIIEGDGTTVVGKSPVEELSRKGDEKQEEKALGDAADAGEELERLSQETPIVHKRETVSFKETNGEMDDTSETQLSWAAMLEEVKETAQGDEAVSSEVGEEPSEAEPMERVSSGEKMSLEEENNGNTNYRNQEQRGELSDSEKENEGGSEELEKIAWPIGVPWEPVERASLEDEEAAKKKDGEVKVIPMPDNVDDMIRLIKDVKHQATIYGSFYKHWMEVADRAVKEIMNRAVMPSERALTDEQVPYFFHLYVEPDIEIGVENDDETVLLPDPTREKITCEFSSLYFNLADKPGKGGQPWL